jgi:hypothetical protein
MEFRALELGGGVVDTGDPGNFHLTIPGKPQGYADAQIDDSQGLARKHFKWAPPATMKVHARATPDAPNGTFGFGFWNDPFSISLGMQGAARRLPVPPQTIWFFYGSPPNDIQLTPDGGGAGWKAMTIRSPQLPGYLTLPPAIFAVGLAQLRLFRRMVMRAAQGMVQVSEVQLPHRSHEWHAYEISWEKTLVRFFVDEVEVLVAYHPPDGPLSFVAWIDNQYAVASPDGGFRFGVVPTEGAQILELSELSVEAS